MRSHLFRLRPRYALSLPRREGVSAPISRTCCGDNAAVGERKRERKCGFLCVIRLAVTGGSCSAWELPFFLDKIPSVALAAKVTYRARQTARGELPPALRKCEALCSRVLSAAPFPPFAAQPNARLSSFPRSQLKAAPPGRAQQVLESHAVVRTRRARRQPARLHRVSARGAQARHSAFACTRPFSSHPVERAPGNCDFIAPTPA